VEERIVLEEGGNIKMEGRRKDGANEDGGNEDGDNKNALLDLGSIHVHFFFGRPSKGCEAI
jgi:hypothetical protein